MTSIKKIIENWHFTIDDVQLNIPEGKGLCLDMGCGDGNHRYLIEKAGWHWIGLDIDVERGGAILVGDGMQLPFLDESLEIVLLMQVLEHLPQPWKVLNNVNCVLKPGGWIVGSVSCMEPFHDVSSYLGLPTRV